jgi:hypothetical protein
MPDDSDNQEPVVPDKPDVTMIVTKAKGSECALCDVMGRIAERKGEKQHVLFITVELESDFEKKLAGMKDDTPQIEMLEGKKEDTPDEPG